jgi:monoterpene epsilon-lactone hydrolase
MAVLPITNTLRALVRVRRRMRGPMLPSWGLPFETWARFLHHYTKHSSHVPLSMQRRMIDKTQQTPVTRRMRFERVQAGGVPGEWFRAPELDESRVLFYLHGGGYTIGSIESHRDLISRMCLASGVRGLAIDYRLAPEHPFPAQLEDALAAYRWLLASGVEASRIVIAGESAGGGLTLSTLVSLRDAREALPAAAAVICPWVDLEGTGASVDQNARYDYITRDALRISARRFAREDQQRDPLAAPLYADLHGLPPLLVQAGGAEALLDDARRIADRARAAGVDVTLEIDDEMIHVWHMLAQIEPRGQEAIDRVGAFARRHLGRG